MNETIVHVPRGTAVVNYSLPDGRRKSRKFKLVAPADARDRDLYRLAEKSLRDVDPLGLPGIHKITLILDETGAD
jgi:hypothetical protein